MGRYSSGSDSSESSSHKKKRKSKKAKSRSPSPRHKLCKKKLKKYKSSDKSPVRDRKRDEGSKRYQDSRSPSRSDRYRRSRSRSRSRKYESSSRSERRRDKKKYSKKRSRSVSSSSTSSSSSSSSSYRKKSSKRSRSKSPPSRVRKFEYDADELLMKLNKAAIEAMAANKKIIDPLASIELQMKRQDLINQIQSDGFTAQSFISGTGNISEDAPVVVEAANSVPSIQPDVPVSVPKPKPDSLLHENFLLESEDDKLNRWVKKLYQIRQRALNGDSVTL